MRSVNRSACVMIATSEKNRGCGATFPETIGMTRRCAIPCVGGGTCRAEATVRDQATPFCPTCRRETRVRFLLLHTQHTLRRQVSCWRPGDTAGRSAHIAWTSATATGQDDGEFPQSWRHSRGQCTPCKNNVPRKNNATTVSPNKAHSTGRRALGGTQLTDAVVADLKKALTNCHN